MSDEHRVPSLEVPLSTLLRVPPGPVDLDDYDPAATVGYPAKDDKDDADDRMIELDEALSELQERLYAYGRSRPDIAPAALLVLQGMDTAGKGGVLRHTVGMVDVQGLSIAAFKKPTPEELEHDFLWRIRKKLPDPGYIGTFDRSHYEDVLVARVDGLAEPEEIERRYEAINEFEAELVARGVVVIKCFLNVSYAEQGERLMERLERPDKHWKYNLATSTRVASGRTTVRRTRSPWNAATASPRPGTSSPPTASGTATGRWPSCWGSSCRRSTWSGRWPTSTSTRRRSGSPRPSGTSDRPRRGPAVVCSGADSL